MTRKQDDSFFIGWAETPEIDRRFFLKAGIGLSIGTVTLGTGLAALQRAPGPGAWDQGAVREWRGVVTNSPYAMLRTTDISGRPQTVLLSCLGKCGVAAMIGHLSGKPVIITGSLIQRGRHAMIAVNENGDWIREEETLSAPDLAFPEPVFVSNATLSGEVLDSKCWFGAMRPSEGKVHKACASLCIRGGIPPAFFALDKAKRSTLLIMTDEFQAHNSELLPYVADPVSILGRIYQSGDILYLDAPVSNITRA